ncbi:MAG: hypothetical protein HC896_13180 [Bacteroidales bacterium]|nr:hypothetical protein [Bacteroidales bacterium]
MVGKIDIDQFSKKKAKPEKPKEEKAAPTVAKEEPKPEEHPDEPVYDDANITEEPTVDEIPVEDISEDHIEEAEEIIKADVEKLSGPTVVGRIDLGSMNQRTRPPRKTKEQKKEERKQRFESNKPAPVTNKEGQAAASPEGSAPVQDENIEKPHTAQG